MDSYTDMFSNDPLTFRPMSFKGVIQCPFV